MGCASSAPLLSRLHGNEVLKEGEGVAAQAQQAANQAAQSAMEQVKHVKDKGEESLKNALDGTVENAHKKINEIFDVSTEKVEDAVEEVKSALPSPSPNPPPVSISPEDEAMVDEELKIHEEESETKESPPPEETKEEEKESPAPEEKSEST